MGTSDAFGAVMAALDFPESKRLRIILEYLMTPEQAAVAAAMPGTAPEVAEKTGIAEETARGVLEDLFMKLTRGDLA